MKKFFFSILIIFLIFFTSVIKNSTKNLDVKIFNLKEDLRLMNAKYELVLLDHIFLSSPKKLNEYQKKYFENDLILTNIENVREINFNNNEIIIKEFINKLGKKLEK
jgi:hypothetical protein